MISATSHNGQRVTISRVLIQKIIFQTLLLLLLASVNKCKLIFLKSNKKQTAAISAAAFKVDFVKVD